MIWIATIFMLIVFAHLLRQALAEKRLYEEGVDDAEMAADEGLVAKAIGYFAVDPGDGTASLSGDNSRFARAVAAVRSKTDGLGERIERRTSDALNRDDENSFFSRSVRKVREKSEQLGQKLDARLDAARNQTSDGGGIASEDTLMGRVAQRVSGFEENLDSKIQEKASRLHAGASGSMADDDGLMGSAVGQVSSRVNSEEDSFLERMSKRVSGKLDVAEEKIASRLQNFRESGDGDDLVGRTASKMKSDSDDDFIGRAANKIGPRMDAFDEKLIDKTRDKD